MENRRKISYSGIQPSGVIHLGNYLGAVRNWVALQEEYDCFYSIVDMHAITVRQDPKELRENTIKAYAMGMACGIDIERSIFYIQSHVHTHAEMAWLLSCYTPYGELGRMTHLKINPRSTQRILTRDCSRIRCFRRLMCCCIRRT